jgi:hypothetical protein
MPNFPGQVREHRPSLNFSNGWKAAIRSSRLNDASAPMSGHSNAVLVRAGLLGGDCFGARAARPCLKISK